MQISPPPTYTAIATTGHRVCVGNQGVYKGCYFTTGYSFSGGRTPTLSHRGNWLDGIGKIAGEAVLPVAPLGIHVGDHLIRSVTNGLPIILRHYRIAVQSKFLVRKGVVQTDYGQRRVCQKTCRKPGAN